MAKAADQDAKVIGEAYQDHVKAIFIGLCTNLEQGQSDAHSIDKFTKGYNTAKHAKDLALGVVGAAPHAAGEMAASERRVAHGSR
jgi:hypothetical protein